MYSVARVHTCVRRYLHEQVQAADDGVLPVQISNRAEIVPGCHVNVKQLLIKRVDRDFLHVLSHERSMGQPLPECCPNFVLVVHITECTLNGQKKTKHRELGTWQPIF